MPISKPEALAKLIAIRDTPEAEDPNNDIDKRYAAECVLLALIDDAELDATFWEAWR